MMPRIQARVAKRFGRLGVSGVVLTHLDEAVGLGVILNTIEKLEWGLSYVTDGEIVPNHIEEACAERMAALIFPAE
jgi:flagellar biosynthesis GTPase FlhF